MKEDYLWEKTGSDPEIEQLENALQVFRYKETAPPELPAKVIAFPFQRQRKTFQFAMAAAACIAFGVISLGVWFQILKNNMGDKVDVVEINKTQDSTALPEKSSVQQILPFQKPDDSVIEKTEYSVQRSERRFIKVRKSNPVIARQKNIKSQTPRPAKPEIKLTEEEQYAYNQLMLALSITSSKLKIVKDKIGGSD